MVDIKAADARLSAAIQQRMAKGGQVDIEAADARLSAAMNGMAGGGVVDLHPRVHEILNAPRLSMKTGGTVQHFDGGGMAMGEDPYVTKPERFTDLKKNAAEMYEDAKRELSRLKSPEARAQLAKIAAAQIAGGVPDLAHLGVDLVLDPLKSVTVDKLLTKPKARSVLEGAASTTSPRLADQPQREPMFGSISDALKTKDGLPIGGSEHIIRRAQDAGLMYGKDLVDEKGEAMIDPETGAPLRSGRFSPLMEIGASVLGGAGASKAARGALNAAQGFGKGFDKGYARAMSKQEPPFLNELGYDSALDKQPVKLLGQQPRVMTALPGTPQGATYATRQEGPFYRVSPTTLDVSKAKTRGIREGDELQGQAPVGGSTGQAGREVPQFLSPEEVGRIISDPAANEPLQIAKRFTKETQGTDFVAPNIPESSLAKQSAIGRAQQLAVEGSPEYKTSVFDAYAKQMPDLLEQAGAKNYDDLMEKAYRQMAKETDDQFKQLPYNFSYHRAGEGNYNGAKEIDRKSVV